MNKRLLKLYGILGGAIFCTFFSYILSRSNNLSTKDLAGRAEANLHEKETVAKVNLDELGDKLKTISPKELFAKNNGINGALFNIEGVALYVYENDSLCYWTDNQPSIDLLNKTNNANIQLIKIRNGWYECIKQKVVQKSIYTLVALIAIKPEYDLQNRFINNNFSKWLELPENTNLVFPATYLNHSVKSKFGPLLFEVYRSEGLYASKTIDGYICLLNIASYLLYLLALFLFLKHKIKREFILLLLFGLVCFISRTLMIYFKIPNVFYNSELYDAKIFADASSFYFSYLGDVFLNSFLIFLVTLIIYKSSFKTKITSKVINAVLIIFAFIFLAFFSNQITTLISSLVNNSTISYNINELFNFTTNSVVGLIAIGLLVFSFYLFFEKVIGTLISDKAFNWLAFLTILFLIIFGIFFKSVQTIITSDYLWPLLLLPVIVFIKKYNVPYNFMSIGAIILIATFIVSSLFGKYEQLNKVQTFEAISLNLTDRQDIIAENEFTKVASAIKSDIPLKNLLSTSPINAEQIEQSLRQVNFSGYFERYEIIMSLFKNDCTPVFLNLNAIYLNEDYFNQQIENEGNQTICSDLYFIDKKKKSIRYISKIDIEDVTKNPDQTFHLYVQLEPKLAANLGTFPDLLLDKSLENKLEAKHISYAIYESNKLLSNFGEYQYPLFINHTTFKSSTNDSYQHFLYSPQKNTTIVITDKEYGIWRQFTSNSYLFIFFSLLVLLIISFNSYIIKSSPLFSSLNNRIQFILVSVVVLSLATVVAGTIWVVNSQFELKNKKELVSKSQSVLQELQQNIGQQESLEPNYKDITTFRLKRLAQFFGSDISLFNKDGFLYATSQPAIYEQGLISRFMNPMAYSSFMKGIKTNYSQKESIGSLKYLSAYIPFYSKSDKLLGYINLPYFARQKDLEKELTAYLTTLINIYTILFIITTIIALIVSNFLTKPLRIIKQQISNVQFGKFNAALHWKSNDEIGNLVTEYNNMLIKLEQSSELLAKSERESAWREMAKQVAHEIKNPLTPMKLNIQHLQRVAETNPEDMNERVKKVSLMLIEQIDTLSHIANEFASFAKLPNANLEVVNLFDVLQNVTNLFQQNTACEISLIADQSLLIMADKEQCLRIFTNLLKNAEQSIPSEIKGKVEVNAYQIEHKIIIKVIDNGAGIAEEIKPKLFTPNFTTKTTGTGLGLAMVKNSVTSFNGTIIFETEINKGTTFILEFPALR